jgi:transcriptional regulator with XRE-family HTH domain
MEAMGVFAETIRIKREELGLSQAEVADRLGVGQQAVSQWEAGASLPRPSRIAQLSVVFGVDLEHLWRLAGFLPERERSAEWSAFHELYELIPKLSDEELWLLVDRGWEELRERHGISIIRKPPRAARSDV